MLFAEKPRMLQIRINGLDEESDFIRSGVEDEIKNSIRKLQNMFTIKCLIVQVDKYHKTGRRKKYSVNARLITNKGMFFAKDHVWDITKAVKGVLNKLEREALRKKGKDKRYIR